jgi:hypothetical protein
VIKTAERFHVLPTAVLDADERLLAVLETEKYAYREEAS